MSARGIKRGTLIAATLIGAVTTAFLVGQNVKKRLGVKANPLKTAQSYPNYAPALISANEHQLGVYGSRENRRKIADGTLSFSETEAATIEARAKRAFSHTPLNAKAITQIATVNFLRTINWADRDMLILAKSRNARDRQTLRALSFIDVRSGNFEALLETFDLRHRLANLEASDLEIIRRLSALENQQLLIETELAANPSWGADYFTAVIPMWDEQEIINNRNSLFIYLGVQKNASVRGELLQLYFEQLETFQLYNVALEDWSKLEEVNDSGLKQGAVYNSEFKSFSAPPPFNWRTFNPSLAHAEIETPSSLFASSAAPKPVLLAQQLTNAPALTPLRFTSRASWSYREQQGHFFWRLSCLPSYMPAYDIVMGDKDNRGGSVSFDIPPLPPACNYQHLELYSQPASFNQRISLKVTQADIAPRASTEKDRLALEQFQNVGQE